MRCAIRDFFRGVLLGVVRAYRAAISPFLPPCCRFHPSCSSYALQALETKPLGQALFLILKRLLRCQPLHRGGYDPVP